MRIFINDKVFVDWNVESDWNVTHVPRCLATFILIYVLDTNESIDVVKVQLHIRLEWTTVIVTFKPFVSLFKSIPLIPEALARSC